MKTYWQPILFFLFVLAFLISAPLVVLYTSGYRYQLNSNKILKTGVLSVSTIPKVASLFIDDKEETARTPVVIDTILPGTHVISLQKDGYIKWSKSLEIFSQSTTFAENVVLFFNEPLTFISSESTTTNTEPKQITETLFDGQMIKISSMPDRAILSFIDSSGISKIIAYLPEGSYSIVQTSNNFLLLVDEEKERLIVVNPNDQQPILLNTPSKHHAWQEDRSRLLFSDGFDIQIYNAFNHTKETLIRLSEPIVDLVWYPKGETILYATQTNVVALELDKRGSQNRFYLASLEQILSISLNEKGDVLTVTGKQGEEEGKFQKQLQK